MRGWRPARRKRAFSDSIASVVEPILRSYSSPYPRRAGHRHSLPELTPS